MIGEPFAATHAPTCCHFLLLCHTQLKKTNVLIFKPQKNTSYTQKCIQNSCKMWSLNEKENRLPSKCIVTFNIFFRCWPNHFVILLGRFIIQHKWPSLRVWRETNQEVCALLHNVIMRHNRWSLTSRLKMQRKVTLHYSGFLFTSSRRGCSSS